MDQKGLIYTRMSGFWIRICRLSFVKCLCSESEGLRKVPIANIISSHWCYTLRKSVVMGNVKVRKQEKKRWKHSILCPHGRKKEDSATKSFKDRSNISGFLDKCHSSFVIVVETLQDYYRYGCFTCNDFQNPLTREGERFRSLGI